MKKDDRNRKIAKIIEIKVQIKLEKLSLFSDIFRFFRFKKYCYIIQNIFGNSNFVKLFFIGKIFFFL
ncbi:hypothetical protein D8B46_01715 [Candidatus Gracilibacteria bacterium]|nr:MAG: hypothetical protein D8B46_01715 [Candidatus Gracilibacteria bacterium]